MSAPPIDTGLFALTLTEAEALELDAIEGASPALRAKLALAVVVFKTRRDAATTPEKEEGQ